ncbi:MAG TPA: bifunctional DNA-formamidopyrimidine glycosylase/DNA-(apurinic or apyrimidinic site) lyase [Gemmatimonadaceae bacterium]|nr:bifunctional DNA-formamidopyrimidine glycosylase/DNA-(apurinic or apyrimidinic site) lyase [Gemmatimonadaceae bacterium]
MPELPETETIARDLDRAIAGSTIIDVRVRRGDVLREADSRQLRRRVVGSVIERAWRRAKLIVLDLSTSDRIVVQPRFTGALLIDDGALPEHERRYSAVEFVLDADRSLHYRDIRRLGTVSVMDEQRFARYSGALGQEPLASVFTVERLSAILRASRQAVKRVLMDQRRLVGVGNIYANETLWRSGIDPSRPAATLSAAEATRLHTALRAVLTEAVAARGTSFRDYRDASGARGSFAERLEAYGREGERCRRCGRTLVATHAIDGRSTVFCWQCQR